MNRRTILVVAGTLLLLTLQVKLGEPGLKNPLDCPDDPRTRA
jgi:hypothetical protein